ncbi:MAG: 3-isopropylmalate dehydratase small subunit [Parahaliea sp.]
MIEALTLVQSVAACIDRDNVDTDMVVPVQFMKTVSKTGLRDGLFHALRQQPEAPFILDTPPFDRAQILVAGKNFGCGSSREHAPWALQDFGIRVIIAESFADIFSSNCQRNGILLIALPAPDLELVRRAARPERTLRVDLEQCTISSEGLQLHFEIDAYRRECLLNGWDEIAVTLDRRRAIAEFEHTHRAAMPWLFERRQRSEG